MPDTGLADLHGPDQVVVKTRDSACHGTELADWLRRRGVDRLVLAGVSTESCIAATATEAYAHDFEVTPGRGRDGVGRVAPP